MQVKEQIDMTMEKLELAFAAAQHDDPMGVLRGVGNCWLLMQDIAAEAAQAAYRAGATKKAIAEALGVPASIFRGMER